MTFGTCPRGRSAGTPRRYGLCLWVAIFLVVAVPGTAPASVDLCRLFPGHPTLCPDPCVSLQETLQMLEDKFASDYERWRAALKTHQCHRIKHKETVDTYKAAYDDAAEAAKRTSEDIRTTLAKGQEQNCSLTDPRQQFEPPKCARAQVDHECYQKLVDDLKRELGTMFGPTVVGGTGRAEDVCKQVQRNENYGRCRQIVKTELPDALEAAQNAKDNADAACGGRASSAGAEQ